MNRRTTSFLLLLVSFVLYIISIFLSPEVWSLSFQLIIAAYLIAYFAFVFGSKN